jgi:hypothetical protein
MFESKSKRDCSTNNNCIIEFVTLATELFRNMFTEDFCLKMLNLIEKWKRTNGFLWILFSSSVTQILKCSYDAICDSVY